MIRIKPAKGKAKGKLVLSIIGKNGKTLQSAEILNRRRSVYTNLKATIAAILDGKLDDQTPLGKANKAKMLAAHKQFLINNV